MFEVKNRPDGINGRFDIAEEKMCELEDRAMEPSKTKHWKKVPETSEKSIREPQGNLTQPNLCVFEVPEGEKRQRNRRNFEKDFQIWWNASLWDYNISRSKIYDNDSTRARKG